MKRKTMTLGAGILTPIFTTASSAFAQVGDIPAQNARYYNGHGMMWGGDQWGGFGMVLGPIFMILILVGIVGGAIFVIRHFSTAGMTSTERTADRALSLLKERYARGEIDSKEFEERKRLLAE